MLQTSSYSRVASWLKHNLLCYSVLTCVRMRGLYAFICSQRVGGDHPRCFVLHSGEMHCFTTESSEARGGCKANHLITGGIGSTTNNTSCFTSNIPHSAEGTFLHMAEELLEDWRVPYLQCCSSGTQLFLCSLRSWWPRTESALPQMEQWTSSSFFFNLKTKQNTTRFSPFWIPGSYP